MRTKASPSPHYNYLSTGGTKRAKEAAKQARARARADLTKRTQNVDPGTNVEAPLQDGEPTAGDVLEEILGRG